MLVTRAYQPRCTPVPHAVAANLRNQSELRALALVSQGSSLFFITYALFQVPSNMILVRVGGPLWLGIIVSIWGIVATLFAGV